MKRSLLTLTLLVFCCPAITFSQCVGGTLDATIIPTNVWQTVTSHSDKFFKFAAVAGNVYTFSYCPCEGGSINYYAELSLDSTAALPVNGLYGTVNYNSGFCSDAFDAPRIIWKCFTSGTYRVLTTYQWCSDSAGLTATLAYKMQTPSLCYSVASMTYAPDPFGAGTPVPSIMAVDDGIAPAQPIGFNFCFNGINYSKLFISSNGYITFVGACDLVAEDTINIFPNSSYTMQQLPFGNTTITQIIGPGVLFPWIDAYPVGGGEIFYKLYGVAPNRHLTVSYDTVQMYQCNAKLLTFEVQIFETTNIIQIQAKKVTQCASWTPPGGQGVEGLLDETGYAAVVPPGRNLVSWTSTNEAWQFTPSCCAVLPIQLMGFDCKNGENGITVSWSTASETNNKSYTLERSSDGATFHTIYTCAGAGNSSETKYYSYLDASPENGANYYRLTQTNFDGHSQTFNVSECNYSGFVAYNIYPNPNDGSFTLSLPASLNTQGISITDVVGREVYQQMIPPIAFDSKYTINMSSTGKGVYLVKISNGDVKVTKRLIVR